MSKVPILGFGWKHGSVRRAFILASEKPSDYTNNFYGNKIHIALADRKNRERFIGNLGQPSERKLFGFFHPYCNAGGGGEKVLWKAVETTLLRDEKNICVIYTGDRDVSGHDILESVNTRFQYELDSRRIVFIFLEKRHLVDANTWPKFTLLGQAYGSIILSIEALYKLTPDYWVDTMGYPFGYPFVHCFADIPIITYTHYPIISSDMLQKLKSMPGFKNNIKLKLKFVYWKIFMFLYEFSGSFVKIAATNSSWTYNHISSIWRGTKTIEIIYPPCSTESLLAGIEESSHLTRKNQAVVIAQFRAEKRHKLILSSFAKFIEDSNQNDIIPKIIMIGSTRNEDDKKFVEKLRMFAFEELSIPPHLLEFKTDCRYEEMKNLLFTSTFGINAMWNEHFGIAVVEYLASGLIPICHASAGPLLDIVVPWDLRSNTQSTDENNRTGFFFRDATDPDFKEKAGKYPDLVEVFAEVSKLTANERKIISERGMSCASSKFSDAKFDHSWNSLLDKFLNDTDRA